MELIFLHLREEKNIASHFVLRAEYFFLLYVEKYSLHWQIILIGKIKILIIKNILNSNQFTFMKYNLLQCKDEMFYF